MELHNDKWNFNFNLEFEFYNQIVLICMTLAFIDYLTQTAVCEGLC